MKNLMIVRHAKSSWDGIEADIDRPLAPRGKSDAGLMAQQIRGLLPTKYAIYSSIATRAAETAWLFSQAFGFPANKIQFDSRLYTFDERELETVIRSFDDRDQNVILFGHNEAITNFVNKFGDVMIDTVATSGFVKLAFAADKWAEIDNGKTTNVLFPRDLKA